jgi:hypothetical protein
MSTTPMNSNRNNLIQLLFKCYLPIYGIFPAIKMYVYSGETNNQECEKYKTIQMYSSEKKIINSLSN